MRLTASALSRAEACIGSVVLPSIPEASDYATSGQALDDFIRIAKTVSRAEAIKQAPDGMRAYLSAVPVDKIPDGAEYQVAFAYNVLTGEVRRIPNRQQGYPDLPPEWAFGSTDIVGKRAKHAFVQDIKWGVYSIGRDPAEDPQIGFYALCAARLTGLDECEVGFLRADWRGDLHPDMAMLDGWALDAMGGRIRKVWERQRYHLCQSPEMAGIVALPAPSPPLSVGSHCTYCPARRSCPAQVQPVALALAGRIDELAAETLPSLDVLRERIGALTLIDKGRLYERLDAAMDYLALAKGILRDDARSEPLPMADGKELREVQWGTQKKSEVAVRELDALTESLKERGEITTVKCAQVRPMKGRKA